MANLLIAVTLFLGSLFVPSIALGGEMESKETRQLEREQRKDAQKARLDALREAEEKEFKRLKIRGSLGAGYGYETGNQFAIPDAPVELIEEVVDEVGSLSMALSQPITTASEVRELANRIASDVALAEEVRAAATEFADAAVENFEEGQFSESQVRVNGDVRLDWNLLSAGTDGGLTVGTSGAKPSLDVKARPFATVGTRAAGIGVFGNVSTGPTIQTVAFGPGIRLANTALILDPICQIAPVRPTASEADSHMICGEIRSLPGRMTASGTERPVRGIGEMTVGVNPESLGSAAELRNLYAKGAFGIEANLRPRHRNTAIVVVEGWGAAGSWAPETAPANAEDFLSGRTVSYVAGVNFDVRLGRNNQPIALDEEIRTQVEATADSR